ncbi:hypothetical protein EG68_00620 [Paragonimus skrjabini miyazakii]|uniref:Fibronectin type-III domain-containing protein n=1 Tax=Paragonimus skrjabini miyazakii TaxID=59628 RepID=A0A8S9Z2V0_9TREM|nr:hypothetical protein EG68_00620 [Paragonimus skrjabini miyazakii]
MPVRVQPDSESFTIFKSDMYVTEKANDSYSLLSDFSVSPLLTDSRKLHLQWRWSSNTMAKQLFQQARIFYYGDTDTNISGQKLIYDSVIQSQEIENLEPNMQYLVCLRVTRRRNEESGQLDRQVHHSLSGLDSRSSEKPKQQHQQPLKQFYQRSDSTIISTTVSSNHVPLIRGAGTYVAEMECRVAFTKFVHWSAFISSLVGISVAVLISLLIFVMLRRFRAGGSGGSRPNKTKRSVKSFPPHSQPVCLKHHHLQQQPGQLVVHKYHHSHCTKPCHLYHQHCSHSSDHRTERLVHRLEHTGSPHMHEASLSTGQPRKTQSGRRFDQAGSAAGSDGINLELLSIDTPYSASGSDSYHMSSTSSATETNFDGSVHMSRAEIDPTKSSTEPGRIRGRERGIVDKNGGHKRTVSFLVSDRNQNSTDKIPNQVKDYTPFQASTEDVASTLYAPVVTINNADSNFDTNNFNTEELGRTRTGTPKSPQVTVTEPDLTIIQLDLNSTTRIVDSPRLGDIDNSTTSSIAEFDGEDDHRPHGPPVAQRVLGFRVAEDGHIASVESSKAMHASSPMVEDGITDMDNHESETIYSPSLCAKIKKSPPVFLLENEHSTAGSSILFTQLIETL